MRTPDRILIAAALGLLSGLSAAWGFEGTTTRSLDVTPTPGRPAESPAPFRPMCRRGRLRPFHALEVLRPRPPCPMPRCRGRPLRSRRLARLKQLLSAVRYRCRRRLHSRRPPCRSRRSRRSGPVPGRCRLARRKRRWSRSSTPPIRAWSRRNGSSAACTPRARASTVPTSRRSSSSAALPTITRMTLPGTPQARYVSNAFVALGHYYTNGIPNSHVKPDLGRARHMYQYAAFYFGDADGQYHLARMMLDNGPSHDPEAGGAVAAFGREQGAVSGAGAARPHAVPRRGGPSAPAGTRADVAHACALERDSVRELDRRELRLGGEAGDR